MSDVPELRVSSYPNADSHVYLKCFYSGLESHGLKLVREETIATLLDPARFQGPRASDILCLHWPEYLWQADQTLRLPWKLRWLHSLRRVVRVARQLRRARRQGVIVTWTVHNLTPHEPDTFVDAIGQRTIAHHTQLWICHSEATRRTVLTQYRGGESRAMLMPIGNFGNSFVSTREPRQVLLQRLGLDPARKTLLCFGVLRHYKGFDLAIQAVKLLGPEFQLIVAGRPWHKDIEQLLRSSAAGMENVALIVRELEDAEIGDLLRTADGAVFPYRRITGSAALVAALTEGVPVVASDLSYFAEILRQEPQAGVLAQPENVNDLARAIRELFALPPDQRRAAARRLADRFSWPGVTRAVAARLRELSAGA